MCRFVTLYGVCSVGADMYIRTYIRVHTMIYAIVPSYPKYVVGILSLPVGWYDWWIMYGTVFVVETRNISGITRLPE